MKLTDCHIASRKVITRALAFLAVTGLVAAKPLPSVAAPATRFPTNSGMVKYHMTMGGQMAISNDITMTWASGGARFRQDSLMHMNARGRAINIQSWTIFDGQALYMAMPNGMPGQVQNRKVAMRMTMPVNYLERMATGRVPGIENAGAGRIVGRGTVLGKPCTIRVLPIRYPQMHGQVKMWMWQNLPLRTETSMMMTLRGKPQNVTMTMAATQLNTNIQPSPSLFRLPAGYQVQNMSALQKQMQAAMQRYRRR